MLSYINYIKLTNESLEINLCKLSTEAKTGSFLTRLDYTGLRILKPNGGGFNSY